MHGLSLPSLLLFGQQAAAAAPAPAGRTLMDDLASSTVPMAFTLLGIAFVLTIVILGIRHARYERQVEHDERMRALEMGMRLPKDEPWWTPTRIAVAIGAGVPLAALIVGLQALATHRAQGEMWFAIGIIGAAGVICGTQLALRLPTTRPVGHEKPHVEPDAFELTH